jgi:capsule polysaccharide export protein KpsE/RkpR
MRSHRIIGGLALAALLASTAGCSQRKVTECNALIKVINDVAALEKAPAKAESDPSGVGEVLAMAEAMDKAAKESEAASSQFTVPEIKKLSAEYQKMVKEVARAEREIAAAHQARDLVKKAAAEQALDTVVKQEDPLIDGINKFCYAQ